MVIVYVLEEDRVVSVIVLDGMRDVGGGGFWREGLIRNCSERDRVTRADCERGLTDVQTLQRGSVCVLVARTAFYLRWIEIVMIVPSVMVGDAITWRKFALGDE